MRYKVVLWDFDGTLAYTGADVWISIEYAAEKCGGKLLKEFMEEDSNLGKSVKEIYQKVVPYPGDGQYEKFEKLIRFHYRQLNEYSGTYLYPGIYEFLKELIADNVKNYIITMKPEEALERILKKKSWENLFDGWISPDSFPECEKTKGELISYIMRKYGFKKAESVYIGDTWSDVRAAHDNKIACIGVTYGDGSTNRLQQEKPEYCALNVSEIQYIIKGGT